MKRSKWKKNKSGERGFSEKRKTRKGNGEDNENRMEGED